MDERSWSEVCSASQVNPKKDYQVVCELTYYDLLKQFLEENNLPYRLRNANKAQGDCWYEAIADQILLHNIQDVARDHEGLREFISNALLNLPQTPHWVEYVFNHDEDAFHEFYQLHKKQGEYTDSRGLICQATSLVLKRNIHIIGTANTGKEVKYTKMFNQSKNF